MNLHNQSLFARDIRVRTSYYGPSSSHIPESISIEFEFAYSHTYSDDFLLIITKIYEKVPKYIEKRV
jgi:hypothetical protein